MSLFQLCKGVECLKVNEFGLPRDKGSFRKGSKVCDRCEDAADRAAGIRPVRMPVAASAAPPPAVETKAPALDRVPCKRCGVPFPPEELNKDGGCKPCKKQSNQAYHERRVERRKQKAVQAAAPAVGPALEVVNPVNRPTPQEQAKDLAAVDFGKPVAPLPPPMQRVDAGPAVDAGPIVASEPSPSAWVAERERLASEIWDLSIRLGEKNDALREAQARELELKRKVTTLEHALTASRLMYEALEKRFASGPEACVGETEEPCMLFLEMLDRWFRHAGVEGFTGTCAELLSRMEDSEGIFTVEERYALPPPSWIGRRLSRLQTKYPKRFSCERREGSLVWTIGGPQP